MAKAKAKLTILKLISNELIIGKMVQKTDKTSYMIEDPLEIYMKRTPVGVSMLFILPWLPSEIVESNSIEISNNQVMYISNPTDKFIAYYEKALNLYNKLIGSNQTILNQNIDEFLSSDLNKDLSMTMSDFEEGLEEETELSELDKIKISNKNIH